MKQIRSLKMLVVEMYWSISVIWLINNEIGLKI
jgi:hypothetical protein